MQRFQLTTGRSKRTWEISRTGFWVNVRELGANGKVLKNRTLQFDDPGKAYLGAENLIAKKLAEGYVEVLLGQTVAPPPAEGNAGVLEQALADDWDDLAAHQAYADALTETGDPRGEFIQVQLALEDPGQKPAQRAALAKQEQSLLERHAAKWLGKRLDKILKAPGRKMQHSFARGWLTAFSAHLFDPNLGQALAAAPAARFLQRLEILSGRIDDVDGLTDESTEVGLKWLAGASFLGQLRHVTFGFPTDNQQAFSPVLPGSPVADLVAQMPRLEELRIFANFVDTEKLFRLNLSSLRRLTLFFNAHYALTALAKNKTLGNLEAMSFQGADLDDYDPHSGVSAHITLRHLKAILASQTLGSLWHLGLRGTLFGDHGVLAILKSGVLERWKTLDLSRGTITDEGAMALAASPSLQRLEWLDLSRNMLTDQGIEALRAARVKLLADGQHGLGEAHLFGDAAYDGDME